MRASGVCISLLAILCNELHAQPINDSVFDGRVISSIRLQPLTAAGQHRVRLEGKQDFIHLFVFLSPECTLSQSYISVLNVIFRNNAESLRFYGIIPGNAYSREEIEKFKVKYRISFPLFIDTSMALTRKLMASVTPQAILIGNGGSLLYKGAIDNWYTSLGKSRQRPTEHYLADAIHSAFHHTAIQEKRRNAVGCLINDY